MSATTNPALLPPGVLQPLPAQAPSRPAERPGAGDSTFAQELERAGGAASGLRFSRHALARVQRRAIDVNGSTLQRLAEGVGRAASKGSRDSLVLVDGTAFVVSVANNTVITAVGSEHMKDSVFTNIDSAVIA
jgi:flagellar operon protein